MLRKLKIDSAKKKIIFTNSKKNIRKNGLKKTKKREKEMNVMKRRMKKRKLRLRPKH